MIKNIASELWGLVKLVKSWIDSGASAEEIMERLGNPEGVGAALIRRAVERRNAGAAYLMIDVEDEPEPEPEPSDTRSDWTLE